MTRLQKLLKAADAMRNQIKFTDGAYKARPTPGHGVDCVEWQKISAATEFLDALKAFDDVERIEE